MISTVKKVLTTAVLTLVFAFYANANDTNLYKMHSLFLYNFTKHIQWSNAEGEVFTIGVYNNQSAYQVIKSTLSVKTAWGKNINVIQISSGSDANKCHIVYAPKSDPNKVTQLISSTNTNNTLIVTEDDFTSKGAPISFVIQEKRLKFKISKEGIEKAGLKVSSSLLSLGEQV